MTGNAICCANAAAGQPTVAPPMTVMNSRRFADQPQEAGIVPAQFTFLKEVRSRLMSRLIWRQCPA